MAGSRRPVMANLSDGPGQRAAHRNTVAATRLRTLAAQPTSPWT